MYSTPILTSPQGVLTLAMIDTFEDFWAWAIVTAYQGPQDYDLVLMVFQGEDCPNEEDAKTILAALEGRYL